MSIKDNISAQVIKAGLRVSFKLPSRLPLPVAGRAIDNIAYFAKESCATLNA